MTEKQAQYVYLLTSTTTNRTYIGYTIDPHRRLRQHNGEIKGGAKATRNGRPWKLMVAVTGFPSKTLALQYEWRNHHPGQLKVGGKNRIECRINIMKNILRANQFTKFANHQGFRPMVIFYDNLGKDIWN